MHAFSSDMTQANGSSMLSSLETAASEARTFKQVISNFRTETTTNLVGQGYNAIRDKMGLYQDALEKLATIADTFKANLVAANNAGLNAMQGYSELNTADEYELTERLHQANAILSILESLVPVYEYSSTSGCYVATGEYRTVGSAESIAAYKNIIRELDRLLRVFHELPGKIQSAWSILSATEADVGSFSSAVSGISATSYS